MPSEYEIYRAYAGMNQPKSGFDYFMEGLKEIQAGAREDKRLALQERSQDRADETLRINKEQSALNNQRIQESKKDKELNDLISAARTDYQKAQIYRSVGGGKYDDIAADLEQNWQKQESNKGIYRESFYGTEEEQAQKLADFLKSADPSNPLYDKAVVRRNKLLGDIADTADEILADPEFGPSYERFSNTIKTQGESEENIEIARKGLIQIEKEYRAKQQRFFKDKTKRTSPIGAVEVEDHDPVVDYLLEGTETGKIFAGIEEPAGGGAVAEVGGKVIAAGGVEPQEVAVTPDVEKIRQSDLSGKVSGKTTQQRAKIIGKILGRDVSEEESEELIRASIRAGIGESAEEFLQGLGTGIAKKRYPAVRAATARQAG